MPCSEARMNANRINAQRSTGPKTDEGKEASRRNSFKHGLTGAGVVTPVEDEAEIAALAHGLEAEFSTPGSTSGRVLARLAATLSVRFERGVRHEAAATAERVRTAVDVFDETRQTDAEQILAMIAENPATNARRLRRTPEGIDLMVEVLTDLRFAADEDNGAAWSADLAERFDHLTGRRLEAVTPSPCQTMTGLLLHADPAQLDPDVTLDELHAYVSGQIVALIDAELADLAEIRADLDLDAIAASRAQAGARAEVGDDPACLRARKYAESTQRALLRTLADLRRLRPKATDPTSARRSGPSLGSFLPAPPIPPQTTPKSTITHPRSTPNPSQPTLITPNHAGPTP